MCKLWDLLPKVGNACIPREKKHRSLSGSQTRLPWCISTILDTSPISHHPQCITYHHNHHHLANITISGWWFPSLKNKNISRLEWLFPIYGNNVFNHQHWDILAQSGHLAWEFHGDPGPEPMRCGTQPEPSLEGHVIAAVIQALDVMQCRSNGLNDADLFKRQVQRPVPI